jgi:hypothetical protein
VPAVFWLIVVALAIGVGASAAWPWLQERGSVPGSAGDAPEGAADGAPPRPNIGVPIAVSIAGIIVAMVVSFLFPSLPVFLLVLPLIWWQRRSRRGPGGPPPRS